MPNNSNNYYPEDIFEDLPVVSDSFGTYQLSVRKQYDFKFISLLNEISNIKVSMLARWLNVTPKTFKGYTRNKSLALKDVTKEHVILLLSLYKHGEEVFGTFKDFESWLMSPNILLDKKAPSDFLDTTSGIRFIDSRLTAIEFGENV